MAQRELKFENLSKRHIKHICNGCGGKGMWIQPPDFIFKKSCNKHDFEHWLGHTEKHRKESNDDFYISTKDDIKTARWYLKPHYHIWAFTYHRAVKYGSKSFFYYADSPKTWEDLEREIREARIAKKNEEKEK